MTAPGVYDDLDEQTYHADPALSSTGARRLLPPSCPARFKWERDNGRPEKRVFDFGHAAHAMVLGVGAPIRAVDATDWRTKVAKQQRDEAYAEGVTPLLVAEVAQVQGMASALRDGLRAFGIGDLFDSGQPEVSAFWHDEQHGVDRRTRFDWLPETDGDRLVVVDYKTTPSAEPRNVVRTIASFGYHQQAAWYVDTAHALGLAESVSLRLVFQEKFPPYLVNVVDLDAEAMFTGRALNEQALKVFAECSATDHWPGYTDEIETVSLPGWAVIEMSL